MREVVIKTVAKNKIGRVITNDVKLEVHEYDTMYFLAKHGIDIEVVRPNNTPRSKSPDFLISGAFWEAKSPSGSGNSTIARQFHKASKQADRLILDLRRVKIPAQAAENEARKRFLSAKNIKRLMLITKTGKLIDIKR